MSTATIQTQSATYKVGWWIMFSLSVLGVLIQVALIFVDPKPDDYFIAWATLSLYSAFVLLIPFRQGEKWAWYLTWVLVIPAVVVALTDRGAAPTSLTAIGLLVIGQLLTRGAFFSKR